MPAEEVRPGGGHTVRLPEDVIRPVQRLDSRVARAAGIRHDPAAVEEGQESLYLVPLRVVDGVTSGHRELDRGPGGWAGRRVEGPHRGVDGVRRECLLRALHRHDLRVPRVGEVPVEKLEPGRRLDVSQLEVGDVHQATERAARRAPRATGRSVRRRAAGRTEVIADEMTFTFDDLDGPIGRHGPTT
jgi:hypothetical protein